MCIAMTSAQTRIADHIATFYQAADRTSDVAMASHAYKQSVMELDDVIGRELVSNCNCTFVLLLPIYNAAIQDAPYRTTIMEPLGKMNAYFPVINEQISKRNKKVTIHYY